MDGVGGGRVGQNVDAFMRDCSRHALSLHSKPSSTPQQIDLCLRMLRKPASRFDRLWKERILRLKDAYEMSP